MENKFDEHVGKLLGARTRLYNAEEAIEAATILLIEAKAWDLAKPLLECIEILEHVHEEVKALPTPITRSCLGLDSVEE